MIHPCCRINQYFIPSYGSVTFHCMYIATTLCLFAHPSVDIWVVSIFRLLRITLLRILMYHFLCGPLSSLLLDICTPRSGIAGSFGNPLFNIWKNCQTCLPQQLHHRSAPPAVSHGPNCSTSSPTLLLSFQL